MKCIKRLFKRNKPSVQVRGGGSSYTWESEECGELGYTVSFYYHYWENGVEKQKYLGNIITKVITNKILTDAVKSMIGGSR